jgi:hypothetical protein
MTKSSHSCSPDSRCTLCGGTLAAPNTAANDNTPAFADDIIRTAAKIAVHMHGDASMRRNIYYLAQSSNLPFFRIGSVLCIRRSALDRFIAAQEERRSNKDDSKRK